jgi:uncharacterized phage protein (TIGR01671 family)
MKQEIEFRVWDLRSKEWRKFDLGDLRYGRPSNYVALLDTNSWVRFTGFKDKNEVKIFEGDILRYTKKWQVPLGKNKGKEKIEYHYYEVFMSDKGQWCARRNLGKGGVQVNSLYVMTHNHEIVGNIYQNKNLLDI